MEFDGAAWESVINETAELLRSNSNEFWAGKLLSARNSPTYVKSFFGGSGSLNDIVLSDPIANERFAKLLNQIHAAAAAADRS
jgi:hypothetical protein